METINLKELKREAVLIDRGMSSERRSLTEEEAKTILEDPNIFNYIVEQELSKQIVGERNTIHTIFLCANGRLVENGKYASYNLMVNDESGAGKDWVVDHVLKIIPKENAVKRTRISERVFTYWHNPKFDPDWTWNGKVFYNEDISNSVLNCDVFKVMASSGSFATVLVNQTPYDIEIRGKPVIIITTASANPNPENVRRFTILNLDTSRDQTKAILKRQIEYAKKGHNLDYDEIIMEAQAFLKMVKVKIPYADELNYLLDEFIPVKSVLIRTIFERFLDLIKASCAFHQFQRETDEGFKIADGQDYDIARIALLKLTSNQYMIPLTKDQKKILDVMKQLGCLSTIEEVSGKITFMSDRWLREQLDKLANYGFLEKDAIAKEDSDKKVIAYSYAEIFDISIPTWEELQKSFNSFNSSNPSNSAIPSTTNEEESRDKQQLSDVEGFEAIER